MRTLLGPFMPRPVFSYSKRQKQGRNETKRSQQLWNGTAVKFVDFSVDQLFRVYLHCCPIKTLPVAAVPVVLVLILVHPKVPWGCGKVCSGLSVIQLLNWWMMVIKTGQAEDEKEVEEFKYLCNEKRGPLPTPTKNISISVFSLIFILRTRSSCSRSSCDKGRWVHGMLAVGVRRVVGGFGILCRTDCWVCLASTVCKCNFYDIGK